MVETGSGARSAIQEIRLSTPNKSIGVVRIRAFERQNSASSREVIRFILYLSTHLSNTSSIGQPRSPPPRRGT